VDLRQKVPLLDSLSFGEPDFGELTVDLGLYGDGCDGRDGAERVDDDTDIALADDCGADRLGRASLRGAPAGRRWLIGGCRSENQVPPDGDSDQHDQADD